jgi:hypothetical protein
MYYSSFYSEFWIVERGNDKVWFFGIFRTGDNGNEAVIHPAGSY